MDILTIQIVAVMVAPLYGIMSAVLVVSIKNRFDIGYLKGVRNGTITEKKPCSRF